MDKVFQPENPQRTKSMLSIVVDDFDSKLQKEHVEKEKPCDDHLETSNKPKAEESKGRAGTPDKSIQKILDEVEHRKDEFRKLLDEHNAVIQNLKKIEKIDDSNLKEATSKSSTLAKTPIPIWITH